MPRSGESRGDSARAQVGRRDVITLLAGIGIGGGGTLLGYQVAGQDRTPSNTREWDREAAVVVVGYGAAGAAAALESAQAGADTLVLEATEDGGGASVESDGLLYLGGGTEVQETLGVFDSDDKMRSYMEMRYPHADQSKIDSIADNSLAHHNWLVDLGLTLYTESITEERVKYVPGGGLNYSGAEPNYPYNDELEPMQRGHKIQGDGATGDLLFNSLDQAAQDAGAEIAYGTPAERLITDDDGNVLGVVANDGEESINVRATGDVIIATGPFDMNEDMIRKHAPAFLDGDGGYSMIPVHDGAGIRMAQAAGASVENMGNVTAYSYIYPPEPQNDGDTNRHLLKGILLNQYGVRFMNEARPAADIGTEILQNQDGIAYFLADGKTIQKAGGVPDHLTKLFTVNNYNGLINRIQRELGISFDTINNNIGAYNGDANSGRDPQFNKRRRYLQPQWNPPFHLFDLGIEAMEFKIQTHGGLSTKPNGRVLDLNGDPIPGLRAAPRAANALTARFLDEGMQLSTATWFGRRAGQAAAANAGTTTSE